MKRSTLLPEEELIQRAIDALMAALGPVETIRFLSLPRQPHIDSIRRHREWQDQLDPEAFFDEIFGPQDNEAAAEQP